MQSNFCKCTSFLPFEERKLDNKIVVVCCKECVIKRTASPNVYALPDSKRNSFDNCSCDCNKCPTCLIKHMCKSFWNGCREESAKYNESDRNTSYKERESRKCNRQRSDAQPVEKYSECSKIWRRSTGHSVDSRSNNESTELYNRYTNRENTSRRSYRNNISNYDDTNCSHRKTPPTSFECNNRREEKTSLNCSTSQYQDSLKFTSLSNDGYERTADNNRRKRRSKLRAKQKRKDANVDQENGATYRKPPENLHVEFEDNRTESYENPRTHQSKISLQRYNQLHIRRRNDKTKTTQTPQHQTQTDLRHTRNEIDSVSHKSKKIGMCPTKTKKDGAYLGRTPNISDIMQFHLEQKDQSRKNNTKNMNCTFGKTEKACIVCPDSSKNNVCQQVEGSLFQRVCCCVPICINTKKMLAPGIHKTADKTKK